MGLTTFTAGWQGAITWPAEKMTCEKRDLTRDLRLAEEAQADHCQTFERLCAVDLEWVVKAERHWMREFTNCWKSVSENSAMRDVVHAALETVSDLTIR